MAGPHDTWSVITAQAVRQVRYPPHADDEVGAQFRARARLHRSPLRARGRPRKNVRERGPPVRIVLDEPLYLHAAQRRAQAHTERHRS